MKNKNKQIDNALTSGLKRIDEIKSKIASYNKQPKLARAEVYEMWQDVFESENQ